MAERGDDPPGLLKHSSSSLNQLISICVCVCVCVHSSARAPSWLLWVMCGVQVRFEAPLLLASPCSSNVSSVALLILWKKLAENEGEKIKKRH